MNRRDRALHRIKTALSLLLAYTGLLFLIRRHQTPRIHVVAYHRVRPAEEMAQCAHPERNVSTASFEKQLHALGRLCRIVSLSELQEILAGERPLLRHVALVTLDDGYRDNYEHALPILHRLGIPATFFLSLGFVEEGRGFWFDRLAVALRAWDRGARERRELRTMLPAKLAEAFDAPLPEQERLQQAEAYAAALPIQERRALLKSLTPELVPAPGETPNHPLTWDEVREMREMGMNIGAHGVSHTVLTLLSAEEARAEIEESLHGIEARVGTPATAFAYPGGEADPAVASMLGEAGVRVAFTLDPRPNGPKDDPLLLGRRRLCEASSRSALRDFSRAWFWCELAGIFDALFPQHTHAAPTLELPATPELRWTGPLECTRLPHEPELDWLSAASTNEATDADDLRRLPTQAPVPAPAPAAPLPLPPPSAPGMHSRIFR